MCIGKLKKKYLKLFVSFFSPVLGFSRFFRVITDTPGQCVSECLRRAAGGDQHDH